MLKRGQVTVFVIVAIFIIVAGSFYFIFKNSLKNEVVPESIAPIQESVLSCLESFSLTGISYLESTGGYIKLPEFEAGSRAAPFSSQLTFAGVEIPYWDYPSATNLEKEQIPSLENMEESLGGYLEKKIVDCDLSSYEDEGFVILKNSPKVNVNIRDNFVDVDLSIDMEIKKGEDVFLIDKFSSRIDSNLGGLYSAALDVYDKQKKEMFLENYSIDVLRSYAPVDGVEFSCSPKSWNVFTIFDDLKFALGANILSISSNKDKNDYFYQEFPKDYEVNFLTSKDWPSYFEVNPSEGPALVAKPVGNQQGLGVLGFCYVTYHFVYDFKYPVLVQLSKEGETFQFPLVVLIEGNQPRKASRNSSYVKVEDLCENSNSKIKVNTYDSDLNPMDADISYECFGSTCYLGSSEEGVLESYVPQCVNGKIISSANGYKTSKTTYSSVEEGEAFVLLEKEYGVPVNLLLGDSVYNSDAIIIFDNGEEFKTLVYPDFDSINLSAGKYNVEVYIYDNSSIELDEVTEEQCIKTYSGIGGVFGIPKEECFDIKVPGNIGTNVLIGGGKGEFVVSEEDLKSLNLIELSANRLEKPNSLDELQENYILFEVSKVGVNLK